MFVLEGNFMRHAEVRGTLTAAILLALLGAFPSILIAGEASPRTIQTVPGMPPVIDPNNLYSETRPDKLSPIVAKHLHLVYVPNRASNDVWVIDPATLKVIDKYKAVSYTHLRAHE